MRAIDVGELYRCETCFHNSTKGCSLGSFACDHGEAYRPAYSRLRIVDAVPVVRCEDCYNWDRERTAGRKNLGNLTAPCSEWSHQEEGHTRYTLWNGFCNYGERRDECETD